MGNRETKTLRLDPEVDDWLDRKAEEWETTRSEIINRVCKVYGGKVASGQWTDPKFKDKLDAAMEDL